MTQSFLKVIVNSIKHWYLPLIAGIIFIGVGIYVFAQPATAYVALSIVFSISFLVIGISDIAFAIANREEMEGWGWDLAMGILTLLIGILLIVHPEISMLTLPFFVGFVLLFRSIMAIGVSLELKKYYINDWGYLLAIGILGIIFSFILLFNPGFAGLTVTFWTAITFIVIGAYSIFLSVKLKKLHDLPKTISNDLKDKFNQVKNEIAAKLNEVKSK